MSDKTAQLGIVVDPTGVEAGVNKAKQSLAGIGATAEKVGEQASKGLDKVGQGGAQASQKIDAATRSLIGQLQRTSAALQAGGRNTREYYETLANQRGANLEVLKPYLAQLEAVTAAQKRVNASAVDLDKVGTSRGATGFTKSLDGVGTSLGATGFGEAQKSVQQVQQQVVKATAAVGGLDQRLNATGLTAKQTAAALRQVPAQFTDIVVSLQGGQNPLTVLLQQGGQLKDVFGGAGAAARALGGYIASLVTPFTLLGAGLAAVAFGYLSGAKEAQEFNRTLILSGNQAGVTAGQLGQMAERLDAVSGTQSRASEVLNAFAGSSIAGARSIERFAAAAIALERAGGPAAEETAKAFAELGKAPLQASLKLNEATGFLTKTVYEQIKALEEQGKTVEAARVAQDAYADAVNDRVPQLAVQLGVVERAWKGIKDAAAEALDAIKAVGRVDNSIEGALARARRQRDNAIAVGDALAQVNAEEEIRILERSVDLARQVSEAQARGNQQLKAKVEFDKLGEQYLTSQAKAAKEIAQATDLAKRSGLLDQPGGQKVLDDRIASIRAKYAEKTPRGKTDELRGLEVDLGAIERDLRQLTGAYADAEAVLAAQRQAGLLDEQDYYEARRAFIRLNTEAQVRALQAENAAIQSSIDGGKLRAEERTRQGEKVKDNVAQIQALEAKAAAQTGILAAQQTSAINGVSRAYAQAQQAAQDYLDALARAGDRELQMLGLGDRARERLQGRQAQEDRFDGERRRIENERSLLSKQQGNRLDPAQEQRYKDELAINEEFRAKALQQYEQDVDKRLAAEGRWQTGASRAMQNYLEEAQNISAQTARLFENAFRGMEDSLVEFVKTGKLDFKSLADSIVADLARIIVKQQLSKAIGLVGGGAEGSILSAAFGAFFGGGGTPTVPGRAIGGPVSAGQLYRVNERKPELLQVAGQQYLMMGNQGGQVKPEASSGPATVQTFQLNVNVPAGANRATAQQTGREIARSLQVAMARGG